MKEKDNSRDADYEEDDDEDFSCEETSTETILIPPPQLKLPLPLIIDLFLITCIKCKTKMANSSKRQLTRLVLFLIPSISDFFQSGPRAGTVTNSVWLADVVD